MAESRIVSPHLAGIINPESSILLAIHFQPLYKHYTNTSLHYITLHDTIKYNTTLHCTVLHLHTPCHTISNIVQTLYKQTLHYTTLHYTSIRFVTHFQPSYKYYTKPTLHFHSAWHILSTTMQILHYTTLHNTTLHYTT